MEKRAFFGEAEYFQHQLVTMRGNLQRLEQLIYENEKAGKTNGTHLSHRFFLSMHRTVCAWSRGESKEQVTHKLKRALAALLDYAEDPMFHINLDHPDQYYYTSTMLSMAILLKIDGNALDKMVRALGNRGRNRQRDDWLEYLFSYGQAPGLGLGVRFAPFQRLAKAAGMEDKDDAVEETLYFLNDYDTFMKRLSWHKSHFSTNGAYVGYWIFEPAVLAHFKGLEDDPFRANTFYPGELVTQRKD